MSRSNTLVFLDINSIQLEDLPDEYKKLYQCYEQLKKINDDDKQQIYELQRNLKTSKSAELHLSQELELLTTSQDCEIDKVQSKYHQELEDYKRILSEIKNYNNTLEQNVEELNNENTKLKEQLEEISKNIPKTEKYSLSSDNIEKELILEKENLELLAKLDDFHDNIQKSMMIIAERESKIEILKEQIQCLEENLLSKREELEEKTALLESTQERMIEMNAEMAMLKSAPENNNRKGNSLFAEVDDQRQVMKQLLAAQKKNYLHMKKIYNESEHEIRRLKRENVAMHNELQTCSSIFLNADKTYKEKLNERIYHLLQENEELEAKLKVTQDRLISLSIEKGINWLDSMLTFCKNETKELKAQLHTCRIQKALLDRNYQNSQQEYAKWRFEALKSRCIIIDRESLLDENGITYKTFTSNDFQFSEKELEVALPQISIGKRRSLLEHLDNKTENLTNKLLLNKENNNFDFVNTPEKLKNISINNSSSKENNIIEIIDSPQNLSIIKTKPEQHHQSHEKVKISGDDFFEIYEDTSTFTPCSSSTTNLKTMSTGINIESEQNIFESSEYKDKLILAIDNNTTNENKCSTIIKEECTIVNSTSFDEKFKIVDNSFEIYEDTTKNCLPLVKPRSIDENLKQIFVKTENKENISINYETVNNECNGSDLILNSSSTAVEKMNNFFEIYEDTIKNGLPLINSKSNDENFKEISVKNENKENISVNNNDLVKNEFKKLKTNSVESNSIDENVTDSKTSIQSILVKEKDILADNLKYVTFDENTIKKEAKSTVKVTTKRIKSNVVIKKIVFK